MANVTTSTTAAKLDLQVYRRVRQAIDQLMAACEIAVNGGVNAAFEHLDDVRNAEQLALAAWITAELWAAQIDMFMDELDCAIVNGTATPVTDDAQDMPEPAPIARPAAELPPAKGRPYWLS